MALGLTNFRIPFKWERIQPTLGGALDTTYFNRIDGLVKYIIGKNATVILDLHNYGRYGSDTIGSAAVTQANFVYFWRLLGAKYKANADFVIFGLMNEPHDQSSALWFAAAQAAINALRKDGCKNTITVPGNGWTGAWTWTTAKGNEANSPTNAAAALNITDSLNNIVFEVHQYFDEWSSGTDSTCPTSKTAEGLFSKLDTWLATNDKYAYIGEFGAADNAQCETLVKAVFARLKANSRYLGTSWWAGGPWWTDSTWYLFETKTLTGQVAQMGWQRAQLIPNQRYAGYDPAPTAVAPSVTAVNPGTATNGTDPNEPSNGAVAVAASWAVLAFALAAFLL